MNVLNTALSVISGIQKTATTKIYNKTSVIINGIAGFEMTEIEARVHAQPLTVKELEIFQMLEKSSTLLKFYIMGDKAEIVDFFKNKDASNSVILWDTQEYSVYGKISWQSGGWIKVCGIKNVWKGDRSPLPPTP